ncbi:TPA: hypothetical protein R4239_003746 [Klebsiella pneumoniae]|nr:hypothetical protein [Klebsiella pneumoniae]
MKSIFLIVIQYVSCILAGWHLPETLFMVSASLMWLVVFNYVLYQIGKTKKQALVKGGNIVGLMTVSLFSLFGPVMCLFAIFMYPLYMLNVQLGFFSFKKIGSNGYGIKRRDGKMQILKPFDVQKNTFDTNGFLGKEYPTSFNNNRNDFSVAPNPYEPSFESSASEPGRFHEGVSHNGFGIDGVNPANGLPMIGNVDVSGNPYGVDRHD